jgi:hypothetical protein
VRSPIEKVWGAVAITAVVEGAADNAVDTVGVAAVGLGVSKRGGRLRKARCALRASSMERPAIFLPVEIQKSVV